MDLEEFWRAVEDARSRAGSDEEFCTHMRSKLDKFTKNEVRQYYKIYGNIEYKASSYGLWGAAYIINAGCGDDNFGAFIAWLISQGRQTYDRIVADPDALAEYRIPHTGTFLEEFEMLAYEMYEQKIGESPDPDEEEDEILEDEDWDFENADEMKARYPKLFERYRAT